MYSSVLAIHSWLRWITLLLAVAATLNAFRPTHPDGTLPGKRWDTFFMMAVDLQVLFGLILYFGLSPITKLAMINVSSAFTNPGLRFWAIEHAGGMFAAVVLVRAGRIFAMNARTAAARRTRRAVCFAIATLVMLASIPWPGLAQARPLFRS